MPKRISLFIQAILIALWIPLSLSAQNSPIASVQVQGTVIDSITGETIPYATIKIYDKAKPKVIAKVVPSDANGKFRFPMNKKGEYFMTIEFIGKQMLKKEFIVANEKNINMGNVQMQDDSKLLGEVVVSAQKPLVKVDLDKITYSLEDDPEAKTNNVLEMLKKVPMVTVDGEDNIELKGSSSFKIYMNGKPSNMISSNPKDILKSMPANTVKDIEVITDPGAKYDAEGVAGIINIITQKNTSMVGYNARVNVGADVRGGYNTGANLTLKAGKLGFMGNYNIYQHKQPRGNSSLYREVFNNQEEMYSFQNGYNKSKGLGQFGSGELSYEIDTLNLINVGFNRYDGDWKNNSRNDTRVQSSDFDPVREYNRYSRNKSVYGHTGINADYQRTSAKVKDRLLTISYRFATSPDEWSSDNYEEAIFNYRERYNRQYSDGKMNEHTFQIDFTTPLAKIHTIEVGAKYIMRQNKSNSGYSFLNDLGIWEDRFTNNDKFKHDQNIISSYLGYSVKVKKIGFKTGLRYESTDVKGKYALSPEDNFKTDYSNLIPSATISYQIKPMQTIRLGYNMRIRRPSIWNLNPYANSTDSMNITFGNPELDAVKSHSLSMNYSYFNPKFNFNANMSYDFSNNNIEDYITIENGVSKRTYKNIGKSKRLNLYAYFSYTPTPKIRINSNLSGNYVDLRSNDLRNLKNSGYQGRAYVNASYTFPLKFRLNGYCGFGSAYIGLQREGSSYNYHGFSLSKDFLNDKLNVRLSANSPFVTNREFRNKTITPDMYMVSESIIKMRYFAFNVSFSFGEMKSQIKKARRSISNDDSMSGSGGGGGESTPQ